MAAPVDKGNCRRSRAERAQLKEPPGEDESPEQTQDPAAHFQLCIRWSAEESGLNKRPPPARAATPMASKTQARRAAIRVFTQERDRPRSAWSASKSE